MDTPYFQVSFRPNVRLVSTVRKFTEEFYARMLGDREMSEKLGLATHELLENAVTYASDGETAIRVELSDDHLVVSTWNRVSPEQLASLATMFDEMNGTPPDAYYQVVMNRAAHRTDGSGLGLARVRAEAEMTVSYEVIDDRVCIRARTGLKSTGGRS